MAETIRIGPWSMFLLVLAGQALIVAIALAVARQNKRANRYMAALLIVLAGMLTPFIIGYAGFYDAYPWLSFAPFAVPLAVGPMLYGHMRALVLGEKLPVVHLAAPALQIAYQSLCFLQPMATKIWIDEQVQTPFVTPVTTIGIVVSLGCYVAACFRLTARYRKAIASTDPARARLRRLQWLTAALGALLIARAAFEAWDLLAWRLDYFGLFPFYVLLALLTGWFSLEGWRNAAAPFPPLTPGRDWGETGREWRVRIDREGWWREPDLSLDVVARRLATNTAQLSRALNASGPGFAETISRRRAEAVAERIEAADPRDLLTLAFDNGFGSKASFNRAFRARFGCSPTAFGGAKTGNGEINVD